MRPASPLTRAVNESAARALGQPTFEATICVV